MATSIDSMAEKIFSINDTLSHQVCLGYKFGLQVYLRYSTNIKKMLTSESKRRADLKILNIRMAQQTDLLVDGTSVTLRHDFIGAGRGGGQRQSES